MVVVLIIHSTMVMLCFVIKIYDKCAGEVYGLFTNGDGHYVTK